MIDITHIRCGRPAFKTLVRPKAGTPMLPENIELLDGTMPVMGDRIICGSCGQSCGHWDLIPVGGFKP
jgi:hypothetical protein